MPRTEAAADPPITEIPCSSTRCRPLAEAWTAATRRNRARWQFLSTARPVFGLWKMPTTKTRSPFFRQSLIPNLTRYDLEISTRLLNSGEGVGFFREPMFWALALGTALVDWSCYPASRQCVSLVRLRVFSYSNIPRRYTSQDRPGAREGTRTPK